MISNQTAIYLLVPNESNERVLYPGKVRAVQASDVIVIEFPRPIAPPVGSDVNVFFDESGRFLLQSGSIIAANSSTESATASTTESGAQSIVFQCVGTPVSADSRGSYRVSAEGLLATIRVEKERRCPLVDVSPEGMCVITKTGYRLGTAVKITFDYEEHHLEGLARVQSVRPIEGEQFRCGLLVPSTEDSMRRSLRKITALVQRVQLRNLRKSA